MSYALTRPPDPCGTQARYVQGCRCEECRAAHAVTHRERRLRQKAGIPSDYDRLDPARTRKAIRWMLKQDMRWTQIEAVTGMERTSLQRMLRPDKKHVSRNTERTVLNAVARLKAHPPLLTRDALLFPAGWTKWQVDVLYARGWTRDGIEEVLGMGVPRSTKVQRRTAEAIDRLFHDWHAQWGPSRRTAVQKWRVGIFPADCYLWENRDTRPIPGSLRPELVQEALAYTRVHLDRIEPTRLLLQSLGQWEDEACARTAMRNWNKVMGFPKDNYKAVWCTQEEHDHSVPAYWRSKSAG